MIFDILLRSIKWKKSCKMNVISYASSVLHTKNNKLFCSGGFWTVFEHTLTNIAGKTCWGARLSEMCPPLDHFLRIAPERFQTLQAFSPSLSSTTQFIEKLHYKRHCEKLISCNHGFTFKNKNPCCNFQFIELIDDSTCGWGHLAASKGLH